MWGHWPLPALPPGGSFYSISPLVRAWQWKRPLHHGPCGQAAPLCSIVLASCCSYLRRLDSADHPPPPSLLLHTVLGQNSVNEKLTILGHSEYNLFMRFPNHSKRDQHVRSMNVYNLMSFQNSLTKNENILQRPKTISDEE